MTIGTGAASLSDIRTEWGRSGAISMSEMYRGGSHVRSKAANNTGSNLASTVPTSGTITIDNFRGTAKGFRFTFSATATNQNASTLFGDDYAVDYPKEIVIDSGVELGATSTSEEALQIDSGASGTITVTNNGTLTGAGGAAGAAGGDAFEADIACTFINNGTIRSGGGGGGAGGNGGTGGGGSYTTSGHASTATNWINTNTNSGASSCSSRAASAGHIHSHVVNVSMMDETSYQCWARVATSSTTNTSGGSGGSGGSATVGQGYNQSAGTANSGSGGAGGGTNAGTGGSGGSSGAGGAFGAAGSNGNTGSTGANGNRTNGSGGAGGASGGAAGAAIRGISSVTLTNSGTITGGQV